MFFVSNQQLLSLQGVLFPKKGKVSWRVIVGVEQPQISHTDLHLPVDILNWYGAQKVPLHFHSHLGVSVCKCISQRALRDCKWPTHLHHLQEVFPLNKPLVNLRIKKMQLRILLLSYLFLHLVFFRSEANWVRICSTHTLKINSFGKNRVITNNNFLHHQIHLHHHDSLPPWT